MMTRSERTSNAGRRRTENIAVRVAGRGTVALVLLCVACTAHLVSAQTTFTLEDGDAQARSTHVVFYGDVGLHDLAQETDLDLPGVYRHMSNWASTSMKSGKDESTYECFTPTAAQAKAMEKDFKSTFRGTLEDVQVEMVDRCISVVRGWWTYKICPEERVEQYHADASGRVVDDERDDIPPVIVLGMRDPHDSAGDDTQRRHTDNEGADYDDDDDEGTSIDRERRTAERGSGPEHRARGAAEQRPIDNGPAPAPTTPEVFIGSLPPHVVSGHAKGLVEDPLTLGRFIVERFENGRVCAETGRPRRTDVLYICDAWWIQRQEAVANRGPQRIISRPTITHVEESPTCNYLAVVHVPSFCSHKRKQRLQESLLCTWCFPANDVHVSAIRAGTVPDADPSRDTMSPLHATTPRHAVDDADEVVCNAVCDDTLHLRVLTPACRQCLEETQQHLLGHFLGTYTCRGLQAMRFSVTYARLDADSLLISLSGDAHFFYDGTYGSYEYIGLFNPWDRKFLLSSGRWHVRPRGFYQAPLRGSFSADWTTLSGAVPSCMDGPFLLHRVSLPPADLFTSAIRATDSTRWSGPLSSLIHHHAPHPPPTAALLHALPREALWFTPLPNAPQVHARVVPRACRRPTFPQLLTGLTQRQTVLASIHGHRAVCFRGICLQLCNRLERPFTLQCLTEMWALTGLPLNAVKSPYRATGQQLAWWQKQDLHQVYVDMRIHRHFFEGNRIPYVTYCCEIADLSVADAVRDLSRLVTEEQRDYLAGWIHRVTDTPRNLWTDLRQVEISGALYRYLHHAHERIGSSIDMFQRTSWEENSILQRIRRFRQTHNGF